MSDVQKVPELTRSDVRALIRSVGDGIVPGRDIYARYVQMMADQEREPVSQKALSLAIRRCGQRPVTRWIDRKSVRCWVVRERFVAWLTPGSDDDLA